METEKIAKAFGHRKLVKAIENCSKETQDEITNEYKKLLDSETL
jgi:hypothetical protein